MTAAAARRRRDLTAPVLIGGIAVLFLVVAVLGALGGDSGDPVEDDRTPTRDAWVTAAEEAFAPIQRLPETWRLLDGWRQGVVDSAAVTGDLTRLGQELASIEPALVDLGQHRRAPLAAPLHLATAQLYETVVDVELVALALPPGEAAAQVDLIGRRLAVVANRIFDRGRAAVGEGPAADLGSDVVVHRPDPVPSWIDEGLAAAGVTAPSANDAPLGGWVELVLSTVPDLNLFDELLTAGDRAGLVAFADQLEAATMTLREVPDTAGSDRSTRVLLGFLLRVEAARLAATGDPTLVEAASRVMVVAGDFALWDPALGPQP